MKLLPTCSLQPIFTDIKGKYIIYYYNKYNVIINEKAANLTKKRIVCAVLCGQDLPFKSYLKTSDLSAHCFAHCIIINASPRDNGTLQKLGQGFGHWVPHTI